VDYQSGHEKTITGLLPALAGANVVYGLGMVEMGITFDLAQLVLDNEVAGMIQHAVGGIPVNDETLAVDVIKEIGIFGNYLGHDTTYNHMRSQSQPKLIDRRMRTDWEKENTDIYDRANEQVKQILENHQPDPLPDRVVDEVRSIVDGAEQELGGGEKAP
jgi:trimethylamine--corrinoid protein Co-methyltransferase